MPMGTIFWVLMIIWFVVWGWSNWGGGPSWGHFPLLFAVIFLLGWHDFGFVVH